MFEIGVKLEKLLRVLILAMYTAFWFAMGVLAMWVYIRG